MTLENCRFPYFISSIPKKKRKKSKDHACDGAFGALRAVFAHKQRIGFWFDRPGGRRITLSLRIEQMVELFCPLSWKWIGLISDCDHFDVN